ncbi:MAG: sulfotransferase family protein [Methylosarcina sp.]
MKPLFIFSLPRSGSTLLQRVLASSSLISTLAEPWLLLPMIYPLREKGVYAEYSHKLSNLALQDFIKELPDGKQDYLAAMGSAILELYAKVSNKEARYFLDKTPRYSLVADEIIRMYPQGKFIYLWRNPLAVIASMIETQSAGRWNVFKFKIDLFDGMANLIDSYQAHSQAALSLHYESFIKSPETELKRIADYLDLEFDEAVLENFARVSFSGKMGDSRGVKSYNQLDSAPLDKWKNVINNPLRKLWCRRYLTWLGRERLTLMGYDLDALLLEMSRTKSSYGNIFMDSAMFCFGLIYCAFDAVIALHKIQKLPEWKWIKHHN